MIRRRLVVALLAMTSLVATAGCAGEPVPPREVSAVAPSPAGAAELTEPPKAPKKPDCGDPTAQSLRPPAQLPPPGKMPAGTTMARIQARGRLVVGVDQNTYNFGYREPSTGEIVGFDIDMARAIAKAIFGDEEAVQLRAITSGQRIDVLKKGEVDIVIRTMSITCERLDDVDFSSVYYQAGQRVLVKLNSGYTGLESLGDRKVCATDGSTSLRNIANAESRPIAVQVPNWTDCLVMLQQNQVDAVSTDDTILAGLAAQDPSTHVVGQPTHTEPYGMAMPKGHEDFVRFVNGVIEQVRTDGRWVKSYRKWMEPLLKQPAVPPVARYRS
jgi:polar amino acid transport system substrate-binding protein